MGRSCGEQAFFAQVLEQRQQWQSQYCKMVAVNLLKQMNPYSFQLIGSHAGSRAGAGSVEIGFDKCVGKVPHCEPRHREMRKRYAPVTTYRNSRMKVVNPPPHGAQLIARGGTIGWLVEAPVPHRKGLVAAYHNAVFRHRRNSSGFLARERQCDRPWA